MSTVASLPMQSAVEFALGWSGADEPGGSGLAFFDVFVSTDGGPFTNWLAHSTINGAVFRGSPGATYRFFTRATDQAGNTEAAPAVADASTTVSLVNNPPTIAAAQEVAVDEGETVRFTAIATDSDLPAQTLRFDLLPGAPPGATLHPTTGAFTWATGEGNGPSTNLLRLRVTDNGVPPQSATSHVTVIVREVNSPPLVAGLTNRVINEGFLLVVTNRASDSDLPAQSLTWSLAPGAPEGATIDPVSGIFRWRPGNLAGPGTNVIRMVVTDNGVPPLSASQAFTVFVRDSQPDFSLALGHTNVLGGETSSVPVQLNSGLGLIFVQFGLEADARHLSGLILDSFGPEVLAATLVAEGTNRSRVRFDLDGAGTLAATRTVAQLAFMATTNGSSAAVPLLLRDLVAISASGQTITNGAAIDGEVIVVNDHALLTTRQTPRGTMKLFGQPGRRYRIESAASLGASPQWQAVDEFTLDGRTRVFPLGGGEAARFFRVVEVGGF